jgi:membrane glycosyltransferase
MEEALTDRKRSALLFRRRALFTTLFLVTVGGMSSLLVAMLRLNGMTRAEYAILVLSILLLLPVAFSFWIAFFGFGVEWRGSDRLALSLRTPAEDDTPIARTAIVVPIHEEEPLHVLARLRATYESLRATERSSGFDFFVLSDTMDPQAWLDEELAFAKLCDDVEEPEHFHYRNRSRNTGAKAGNIADFCREQGGAYECMVILDADSVMSGSTLVALASAMARDPRIGIIQVPPMLVNARSLFGRLQQFSARAYGPTWATGLSWLQDGEGNYYGHNAIIRIAPFVEHCRLPVLPGKPPLGGSILSHDFVEAALLLRAGYRIHLATGIDGSYEESPPTLIDHAVRDRRWCQGNLQHARLLNMRGLRAMSRTHMAMGVTSYVTAPLWLSLLILWTVETLYWKLTPHVYFPANGALFPTWEVSTRLQATLLFALVMLLLFVPRALAIGARLRDAREREGFGGARNLLRSVLLEWILSALIAPILLLEHTRFVIGILLQRSVRWKSQPRGERSIEFGEAARRYGAATLLGTTWLGVLIVLVPEMLWWMLPVLAGMALAIPVAILSSRPEFGSRARARGLLLTPEERSPEPVLRRMRELLGGVQSGLPGGPGNALERVLGDPAIRELHLSLQLDSESGDPLIEHEVQGLVLKCRYHGTAVLTDEEQRVILRQRRALLELVSHRS